RAFRDLGGFPADADIDEILMKLDVERLMAMNPAEMTPEQMSEQMKDLVTQLLDQGARLPKALFLFMKGMMYLNGAIAALAADGAARLVTRYDDVLACARNYEAFSSDFFAGVGPEGARIIIGTDPPDHTNLRRLVTKPFRPGAINDLEPRIRRLANELIDDLV